MLSPSRLHNTLAQTDPYTIPRQNTGTCETISWCDGRNGNHNVNNACPHDGDNVKCCFFPTCKSGTGFCDVTTSSVCHHSDGRFQS